MNSLPLRSWLVVFALGSNLVPVSSVRSQSSDTTAVAAPSLVVRDSSGVEMFSELQNKVVAWGDNTYGQCSVPPDLTGVVAVSAGWHHTLALKRDGTVVAWGGTGYNAGQAEVPAGLTGVKVIAAGADHSLVLKQDGTVVAWGLKHSRPTAAERVPAGLKDVVAIAAGVVHALALKRDGTVVAWGSTQFGEGRVPDGLKDVVAISAGDYASAAVKQDGTVVEWGRFRPGQRGPRPNDAVAVSIVDLQTLALRRNGGLATWGTNSFGEGKLPIGLIDIAKIAAGSTHNLALSSQGEVIAWGRNFEGQASVPAGVNHVVAIAAGGMHSVAIQAPPPLSFSSVILQNRSEKTVDLNNVGQSTLSGIQAVIEGPDADQFSISRCALFEIAAKGSSPIGLTFAPTRLGYMKATLKIYSNDPRSPFAIALSGTGNFDLVATRPTVTASPFTFGPLRLDKQTGLVLQTIMFNNMTSTGLHGLRLTLSKVAPRVAIYGSSAGKIPGSFEVLYTNVIAPDQKLAFDLVYYDPQLRVSNNVAPVIHVQALEERVPLPEPVEGISVPVNGVRDTAQGPLLEWKTVRGKTYVVEYSTDQGLTWFSATHRLSGSTRIQWVDRGQPETISKPASKNVRYYRVKML